MPRDKTTLTSSDDLRRLHFIDTLFSRVTGHDLYLAQQIKEAIAFSLTELEQQTAAHPELIEKYDAAFASAASRLLENFFGQLPHHGFFHWSATRTLTSATPLFARSEIMVGLKQLAPFRESTFLITNLRPALLPPDRNETARRRRDYEDTLTFIRDLAAARTTRSASLNLLFL